LKKYAGLNGMLPVSWLFAWNSPKSGDRVIKEALRPIDRFEGGDMTENELTAKEKMEAQTEGESTRNLPVYIPSVDIYETEDALVVLADMPGVSSESVSIDVRESQLTLRGTVTPEGENERALLKEYGVGDYYRQFTLGRTIDQTKIEAVMKDGVLTLTLPKAETVKPRKIQVKSS
jgi:HSP20 family protein